MRIPVSVILPVRNAEQWLEPSIRSLLQQSLRDFEIVAVDDGSTDSSFGILDGYSKQDPRVMVVRQGKLGLVAALNRGISEAQGAFIARLDADDQALPNRLEKQLRYLLENPAVGLIGSWAQEIDEKGRALGRRTPETDATKLASMLRTANPFVHSAVMMRREVVDRVGGYRTAFEGAEDYDLWLRMAEVAQISNIPEILVLYRVHEASVSERAAMRQAFSIRLAQCSASMRRATGADPADTLTAPPDWHSSLDSLFFSDWAALYRIIDWRAAHPDREADRLKLTMLTAQIATLNHAERILAAKAIADHTRQGGWRGLPQLVRILLDAIRQRPSMAFRILSEWGSKQPSQ